jgi:hypothetical protein
VALCTAHAAKSGEDKSSEMVDNSAQSRLYFQGEDFTINLIPLVVAKLILFGISK